MCVCFHIGLCASPLPSVFWTVTLNESKYSIILRGMDAVTDTREREREDGLHMHPRSPFTLVPVEEKEDRQPFNVSQRPGFFFFLLLTFNSWHNKQPVTALMKPYHTRTHTQERNKGERDTSDAVNSEAKAAVVKWQHSRQLLLLPHCDYCINFL